MSAVLVTGGSRGIGKAIVEEFVGAGHNVAFTYTANCDAANTLVADLTARGGKVNAEIPSEVRDCRSLACLGRDLDSHAGHRHSSFINSTACNRDRVCRQGGNQRRSHDSR